MSAISPQLPSAPTLCNNINEVFPDNLLLSLSQAGVDVSNPLGDDRFAAMFSNPDFQVDEESEVQYYPLVGIQIP